MIRQVQYLRGIAAMMVVWHHATDQVAIAPLFVRIPAFGRYGVDIFFVISGFIMLVTTWDKPIAPMSFMVNRLKRIVPLYWLATLAMVGIAIVSPALFKSLKWDGVSLIKSLLFIPYYSLSFPNAEWPLLVPGWSLNLEMFFYALFALTLLVARNWRVPLMVGTLLSLFLVGLIFHPTNPIVDDYTSYYILEFGIGMTLGRLWVMRTHPRQDGGHPVLMALGDASYSIYLTHIFTLGAMRVLWSHFINSASLSVSIAWMCTALLGCAIAGWACYLLVERPIMRKLNAAKRPELPLVRQSLGHRL